MGLSWSKAGTIMSLRGANTNFHDPKTRRHSSRLDGMAGRLAKASRRTAISALGKKDELIFSTGSTFVGEGCESKAKSIVSIIGRQIAFCGNFDIAGGYLAGLVVSPAECFLEPFIKLAGPRIFVRHIHDIGIPTYCRSEPFSFSALQIALDLSSIGRLR